MSMEEMLHEIDNTNSRQDMISNIFVISTDVVNMFLLLPIGKFFEIAAPKFLNSDLNIEVDNEEPGLYLATLIEANELERLNLSEVVHRKISTCRRRVRTATDEV